MVRTTAGGVPGQIAWFPAALLITGVDVDPLAELLQEPEVIGDDLVCGEVLDVEPFPGGDFFAPGVDDVEEVDGVASLAFRGIHFVDESELWFFLHEKC